ncbi:NlpC/P60 family protein [Kocuria kalidii]|uniref:C40 family peptidase n=1 Tax=Kocuria kalidii TaxID=3376283 RepID=UPI0037A301F2
MTRDLNSSNGIGSLLTGKARTVAAVAAFSGLALATTVSVQAAPAQDAPADAPLSAVAAATPAATPTVSLEPVAHVTKAEKPEPRKAEPKKAEPKAERIQTPVVAAPAVAAPQPVVQAAPAPVVAAPAVAAPQPAAPAPVVAAPAVAAPQPVVQAAPAPKQAAPAPKPVVQAAPAAERSVTTQSSASGKGATISSAAMGQLGVGQDCTALVSNALRAAGINHRGWPASYLGLGTQVSAGQAQPGDIVYYADGGMGTAHIGIYIGGGKAVHGGWNGGTTVIDSVNVGSGPVYVRVR